MLLIEWIRTTTASLPWLVRLGLAALALSGTADVIAHVEASEYVGPAHGHGSAQLSAHLAAFGSMCLIQAGVVLDGVRQARARRGSTRASSKGVA